MLLYIIRHGDPDYANDCLTEKGKKQADALPKRLAVHGLDKIYSSPLGRALQTARPTAELLKLDVQIEEWMSEDVAFEDLNITNDAGERVWAFSCQSTEIFSGDAVREDWYNHPAFATCANAKAGYERIARASDEFILKLGYKREGAVYKMIKPSENRIAAFCHHGLGTTWLSHLLSVPPLIFWASFNLSHSSITILHFTNNKNGLTSPRCLVLSELPHIYEAGLPLLYNNEIKL